MKKSERREVKQETDRKKNRKKKFTPGNITRRYKI